MSVAHVAPRLRFLPPDTVRTSENPRESVFPQAECESRSDIAYEVDFGEIADSQAVPASQSCSQHWCVPLRLIAVGTVMADRPRTDPYVRKYRIRLLPGMMTCEPHVGIRVENRWRRQPAAAEFEELVPGQAARAAGVSLSRPPALVPARSIVECLGRLTPCRSLSHGLAPVDPKRSTGATLR